MVASLAADVIAACEERERERRPQEAISLEINEANQNGGLAEEDGGGGCCVCCGCRGCRSQVKRDEVGR